MTAAAGIVRRARRPPGWRAPGPRPATPPGTPDDRPDLWPGAGEDLCHLAGDWRILQLVRGHRWSLDDLVTAWFGAELLRKTPPRTFVDLGCGIGTVLLLTAWCFPEAHGLGIEARRAPRWRIARSPGTAWSRAAASAAATCARLRAGSGRKDATW